MGQISDLMRFVATRGNKPASRARQKNPIAMLEPLESRQLLSAAVPAAAITPVTITLDERAGVKFTADLGRFSTPAPTNNLEATINWGDGTTSQGVLIAEPSAAAAVFSFEVDGTHKYKKAGTNDIHVTVIQPGPTPTTYIRLVATFNDTAIVAKRNAVLD